MTITSEQIEKRRALRERTIEKLKDPHLKDDIIAHVSSGGSLIELCHVWDVFFHEINTWIYKEHKSDYETALRSSTEFLIQRVRDELKTIATLDIRKAYDDQGRLKLPSEWPDELAGVVAAIETVEEFEGKGEARESIGFTKKLKLWDKLKALELLGKNLSMFIERHEVSGKVTLEDLVAGSMKPDAPNTTV